MEKISRNAPCPCGSGKKYKKCCLSQEDEQASRHREEGTAVSRALDWLAQRYPRQVAAALGEGFFGALEESERGRLGKLSSNMLTTVHINSQEWLINDASIEVKGKKTLVRELLLGPGGLLLDPAGREWLKAMGETPLSLYEVRQVKPGEGMELADLLHPETAPVWVAERSASRSLVRLDVFGARLIQSDSGFVMSGAAYPFARDEGLACRDEILHEMEGVSWGSELAREVVNCHIIDQWLQGLVAERPFPKIFDTSTGEPIMLTTDHYRVRDWQALEALLAAQPDVEGNRKEGWVRFVPSEEEMRRTRAALNPRENDDLEVFCRTLKLAEDARQWLENFAGGVLSYQIREVSDPRSEKALKAAPASRPLDIPPEILSEVIHKFLRKQYANWTRESIPALGNNTPEQAIKTEKGRQAVIDLLKSYEHSEARRGKDQGGEPFDFGFLWERLGLKRE